MLWGPERAVVRGAVHAVLDQLDHSLTVEGCRRPAWGIDLFDQFEPEPQVLLAIVVQALFDPAATPPQRTAVNHVAVAVLFPTIRECVDGEIGLEVASL